MRRERAAGSAALSPTAAARARGAIAGTDPAASPTACTSASPVGAARGRHQLALAGRLEPETRRLNPVFFEYDQSEVEGAARQVLDENAALMMRYPSWVVTIEGHCDERGTAEYNLALGERAGPRGT